MTRFAAVALLAVLSAPAVETAALAQQQQLPPIAYIQPLSPQELRAVQDRLHQAGAYNGAIDGMWGQDSEQALQQFQQTHQLQVTGQMNAATATMLGLDPAQLLRMPPGEASTAPPAGAGAAPPPIRLGPDAIRNVQGQLQRLGFYNGTLDGQWGPGTQEAITRLQQNHNLPATGRLDPATVSAMGLNPANPGLPPPH